jgi:uncharacterized protein (DUF3084 family)
MKRRPPRAAEARQELEALRQSLERALSEARADEREKAAAMLAEGADLRSRLELERTEALALRDSALKERDDAVAAKEQAVEERKAALAERKAALKERDAANRERDNALREAERSLAARETAFQDRDRAIAERDLAQTERDGVLHAYERGLPAKPPEPRRYVTPDRAPQDPFDVWLARGVAGLIVGVFVLVVLAVLLS